MFYPRGLADLRRLSLRGTQVTDAGLIHLKDLPNLQFLDLAGTQVTEAGVSNLKEAVPRCKVDYFIPRPR